MRALPLPPSGPIHFDCREQSAIAAVRNLDDTMRRMRPGPRVFVVHVRAPEVQEAAIRWARLGRAAHEVVAGARGPELHIYLLPVDLGGHPSGAFSRRGLEQAVIARPISEPPRAEQQPSV